MRYRLGLDVGTNSLGWAIIRLNHNGYPEALQDAGVRIFSDGRAPKTGTSLAAERTTKRGARRRRDRFIQRRNLLLKALTEMQLLPDAIEERLALKTLDPYYLRTKALDEPLTGPELARTIIHLNQRRGFKSNRKEASDELKDTQKDIGALRDKLAVSSARTLGEYMHMQHTTGQPTRARPGAGLYPERAHYKDEFDQIHTAQEKHHPKVNWDKLEHILFHQRDLKAPPKGRCQLMYGDKDKVRAYRALPSAELFVLLQNLNNLGWRQKGSAGGYTMLRDTPDLWDKLYDKISTSQGGMKFTAIAKLLFGKAEAGNIEFNLAGDKRTGLEGLPTAYLMHKPEHFGDAWGALSLAQQDAAINALLETQDPDVIKKRAVTEWGLSTGQAENIAKLDDSKFASGTARFCTEALHGLVERMRNRITYWDAAQDMGYDPRGELPDHEQYEKLPYYAEALPDVAANSGDTRTNADEKDHGIIGNPTVHIALNQIRKVVNALVDGYGKPEEVHVELARELKLNQKQKQALESEQRKNQGRNEEIAKEIERINREHGSNIQNTYDNRLRYKLWEEQKDANGGIAICPFSGEKIGCSRLFSSDIEIEHILPFALTLDDSPANKVLATREANRLKGRRAPFEAFGNTTNGEYAYEKIQARAENLPKNKAWRFAPEAMEKFADENKFLARQLTDTQYIAKVTRRYLCCLCPADKVTSSPGRLTAKLRHFWGLNSVLDDAASVKDRTDHRHHAIDAVVVALTDRAHLQKAIRAHKGGKLDDSKSILACPIDTDTLRDQAQTVIGENLIVSHRPDHGTCHQLHEDSNYGLLKPRTKWEHEKVAEGYNLVIRKPLASLTEKEVTAIRDPLIRAEVESRLQHAQKGEHERILNVFMAERAREGRPLHSVRILKKDNSVKVIQHTDAAGTTHEKRVAPGDIHHVAFWRLPEGISFNDLRENTPEEKARKGQFIPLKNGLLAHGANYFDANLKTLKPHPAAKLVMQLHKGDMIQLVHSKTLTIGRISSISPVNKRMQFTAHSDAGQNAKKENLTFNDILKKKVRKIGLTSSGRIPYARAHH